MHDPRYPETTKEAQFWRFRENLNRTQHTSTPGHNLPRCKQ